MSSLIGCLGGGNWIEVIGGGIPQIIWARRRFFAVELLSKIGGSEGNCLCGRKSGERGLSDISGKVRWSLVVVLPIVEKVEMCFESYILDAGYRRRFFSRRELWLGTILLMLIERRLFCSWCAIRRVFTEMLTFTNRRIKLKLEMIGTWEKRSDIR